VNHSVQYKTLYHQLIKHAQAWALRQPFDAAHTAQLRQELLCHNHAHYRQQIPLYRRLTDEEGIGDSVDLATIQQRLMSTDDLFKSYPQRWLDDHDYASMTNWLNQLHHQPLPPAAADSVDLETWLACLPAAGVQTVYSSGTSGAFSFIPRDSENWALTRLANSCYLLPLLMYDRLGAPWQRKLLPLATRLLAPTTFAQLAGSVNMHQFDAVFLDFQQGGTGMQAIGRELAPRFRRHYFLYEAALRADMLRALTRGPRTAAERAQLTQLQAATVEQQEAHFTRLIQQIRQATQAGQRIFIFGAPFQFKAFCEYIVATQQSLTLRSGSLVLFGGGWKAFSGVQLPRPALIQLISAAFGLPETYILEGYSMTEINVFMVRCTAGRFHIPPLIESVILDEALQPQSGRERQGIFGFLDPLAIAYPGFIITGDQVHWVDGECSCGLHGPAITTIARAQHREVKGCAGVMAAIQA
jgi:hypothetical protein